MKTLLLSLTLLALIGCKKENNRFDDIVNLGSPIHIYLSDDKSFKLITNQVYDTKGRFIYRIKCFGNCNYWYLGKNYTTSIPY